LDPIEVTARFDPQGKIIPLSFTWRGHTYRVDSTGRRWRDEAGHHILVMAPIEQVFELLFVPEEQRWYLGRPGAGRRAA
jgi:hypothetical protein